MSFSLPSVGRKWYSPGWTLWNGSFDIVTPNSLNRLIFLWINIKWRKALFQLMRIFTSIISFIPWKQCQIRSVALVVTYSSSHIFVSLSPLQSSQKSLTGTPLTQEFGKSLLVYLFPSHFQLQSPFSYMQAAPTHLSCSRLDTKTVSYSFCEETSMIIWTRRDAFKFIISQLIRG